MASAKVAAEPGIDQDTLNDAIGFKPHSPGQRDYLTSTTRFNIPCCGRRWGKSQAAGHRMTYKMFVEDSYNWIVGPTYTLGEKEFRVVWQDFQKLGLLKHCKKSYNKKQGDMRIATPWGAILEVVSAEKQDSLLGEGLSHAIMSEAARHSQSTWEQYIEPALSDLLGSADFPSTPKGYNWYHAIWQIGQKDPSAPDRYHPDYKSWSFPSWTNPVRYPGGLKNKEIQRIKKIASNTWFQQEYGADFTVMEGSIYEEWDPNIHVQELAFNPTLPNYLAFDYGFVNPFVALDIQIGPDDTCYVWREYVKSYLSTPEHAMYLNSRDNPTGYRVDGAWGDPRGADEEATLNLYTPYFVGSQDVPWKLGVECIKRMLKAKKVIVDPSCVNLVEQMSQLHVKPLSRNSQQDLQEQTGEKNIQHKVNDHCPDALRYLMGPIFVLGAGEGLADIYGQNYQGSESQAYLDTLLRNDMPVTMNEGLNLGLDL